MNLIPFIKKSEDDAVVIGRDLQRTTEEYYIVFGALSLKSSLEDILLR